MENKQVRKLINIRGDKAECVLCQGTEDLTADHILSPKWGGTNHHTNKVILCRVCNVTKGDKTVDELLKFYEYRAVFYEHHLKVYNKLKTMLENRDYLIEELRDLYRKKNYREMKEKFYKNIFYISEDKRKQIIGILSRVKIEPEKIPEDNAQKLIDFGVNEMGYNISEE